MKTRFLFTIVAIIGLTFSATSQTYTGKQKHIDQILIQISNFSKHLVARDHEALVDLYAENAKIFPSNQPILSGDLLHEYWQPSDNSKVTYHKVTPTEIKVIKKIAYDYGIYEGTSLLEDGSEVNWRGKYIIVWHLIGKEWKIYLDCWNRSPMPEG